MVSGATVALMLSAIPQPSIHARNLNSAYVAQPTTQAAAQDTKADNRSKALKKYLTVIYFSKNPIMRINMDIDFGWEKNMIRKRLFFEIRMVVKITFH